MNFRGSYRRPGFTLLELLAVIATIGTLAALLLPILGKAKSKAHQTGCLANLQQLGLAWKMYIDDNNGYLPESYPVNNSNVWVQGDMTKPLEATNLSLIAAGKLFSYHQNTTIYRCPSDRGIETNGIVINALRSYSMNSFMGARGAEAGIIPPTAWEYVPFFAKDSDLRKPSDLWVLLDEDERSIDDGCFVTDPTAHVWYDLPTISGHRHNFSLALNFADGHYESWRYHDPRTRLVKRRATEQSGNTDLDRIAAASSVPKR